MNLDFLPILSVAIIDDIFYIVAILATAASTYASYDAAQTQKENAAKQAEANSNAAAAEAARKAKELEENQRRQAVEQRRFRAQQTAQMSDNGFRLDTGTPLAIATDTRIGQMRDAGDLQYQGDITQRALAWDADLSSYQGAQQSRAIGQQQTAGLISGVSSTFGVAASYSASQRKTKPSGGYGNS